MSLFHYVLPAAVPLGATLTGGCMLALAAPVHADTFSLTTHNAPPVHDGSFRSASTREYGVGAMHATKEAANAPGGAGETRSATTSDVAGVQFALQGSVIAGGGIDRARSACFDLSATIGQPIAGAAASDRYFLNSGFWAIPGAGRDSLFRSSFEDCSP